MSYVDASASFGYCAIDRSQKETCRVAFSLSFRILVCLQADQPEYAFCTSAYRANMTPCVFIYADLMTSLYREESTPSASHPVISIVVAPELLQFTNLLQE